MSLLDTLGSTLFGRTRRKRTVIENDNSDSSYNFNVFSNMSHKYGGVNVNHSMARDLYRNVDNKYALSAHLIRPIIDSVVSFIDTPTIRATNRRVLGALESCQKRIDSASIIRIAEREGTCFVWVQLDEDGELKYVVPRPETVTNIIIDPLTKVITGYEINDVFGHKAIDGNEYQTTVKVLITKEFMKTVIESTDPSVKSKTTLVQNVLGFIPIVRFTNDAEPWELRGHSEITVVEPTLKLYHDMLVDAANAQKQNSPKIKILTKSVKKFIENNFGVGMYERVLNGEGLNLDSRDVYLLERDAGTGESDDLAYVSTSQATGDSKSLLEIAFMNAVEGSQVPELIFGASMGASLSSVQEQRPAFIKRIRRKQAQYAKAWKELFDMSLDILGYVAYAPYDKSAYELDWEDPDFATDKEKADTANAFITALVKARSNGIMGDSEIHSTLVTRNFVELKTDFKEHIAELDKTQERIKKEQEDVAAKKNDEETDAYANGEREGTAVDNVDKNKENQ